MAITARQVADLRAKTGCGMMECKKALTETDGDFDAAIKYLREKGLSVAAKKADRIAAEGVVSILKEGDSTAMIEVNSETDFVAKNEEFQTFVRNTLAAIIKYRPADVEALKACKYADSDITVGDALVEKIATIKENISIRRFLTVDGTTSTYIHGQGAIGIIVKFVTDVADKEGFAEFAKNIALQVAGANPLYLDPAAVPASVIEEEKNILMAQIQNDPKNANKPAAIVEKMVSGKVNKYYETNCLINQAYVKDDKMTVTQYVDATAKALGGSIKVDSFYRYDKGEGLQKREDNFAEEIASMMKK